MRDTVTAFRVGTEFLNGGGETGALIAAHNWLATPLGAIENWPQSLKTATALMLRSPVPMVMLWGEDGVMLYNDAYSVFAGGRHPEQLGMKVREGWPEVAEFNDNVMRVGLAGGTLAYRDQELTLYRHGRPEQVFMNLDYSPVLDERGEPAGVLAIVVETTARVTAERRRDLLFRLDERMRDVSDTADLSFASSELLGQALGAVRVGYGVLDSEARTIAVERNWSAPGFADVAGLHHFQDYGTYIDELLRGAAVANADAETDERTATRTASFRALGIRAHLDVPVVEDGQAVAQMFVHSPEPRVWTEEEVALVREVASRTRAAIARRAAEAKLRASEARLRAALQIETVGAIYFDMEGTLIDANDAFLHMSGYSRADVENGLLTWRNLTPPEYMDVSEYAFAELKAHGVTTPYEKEYVRKDGSRWWALFAAKLLPDATGLEFVLDITDRKRAEADLQRLNETLEAQVAARSAERDRLWNLSEDLLARADYGGMMSAVSPAWSRVLGWDEAELLSRGYATVMHPDDMPPTLEAIGRMAETRRPTRFENRIATRDGGWKSIEWTVAPEPDGANFIAVGRDVTGKKEHEAELAAAQEALRQAQKMEAVGQLTGGIAHDFNNLLTGIVGSLDLLQRRAAEGRYDHVQRYTNVAITAAQRAAALTQRLLAFSRRQPLDPKPVGANKLVASIEELLRRTLGPAIHLEFVLAGGLWPTLCDPNQLESAILNLAINARDAMPEGGRLTVETGNAHLDAAYARAHAGEVEPGQYVMVAVTDTGTGIPRDQLSRIFEPFFTTKPIGQGTGLGLSQLYGFAKQSGGHVKVYSEEGQGTTFRLYLPRHRGKLPGAEAEEEPEAPARAEIGETVLVVDDEAMVRMLITETLEELGYAALEGIDGPSGLKVLQSDHRIDLLVTDVGLPGLNGRQLADAARELRPDLKVLFITGYAGNAAVGNGVLDPGMEILPKPFAMEQLAGKIREMMEQA